MLISEKRSKINYYSFLWHAVFLALASNFMDVDTIIPSMLLKAGGNSVHLGFLTAIMLGGASIFQLLFAPLLSKSPTKKTHMLIGINLRIISLFAMALMFIYSQQLSSGLIIFLIFIIISVFSLSGSYANVAYIDVIGKSIKQEVRKRFFSVKQVITSIGILLSAFIVRQLIKKYDYPLNYTILSFLAGALLLIASFGFWNIKEPFSSNNIKKSIIDFFKIIPEEIKKNPYLKHYLIIINTAGLGIGFTPFLILLAKSNFGVSASFIGNVLVLKVVGMLLAGSVLYKFSKKFSYRQILTFNIILGFIIPILALLLQKDEFYFQFIFILTGIFVSIMKISNSGILLEISNNENRTIYAGIAGAGKIFSTIFPLLSGILIYYLGFTLVFISISLLIIISIFSVKKLNC
jgi:MFS family permease